MQFTRRSVMKLVAAGGSTGLAVSVAGCTEAGDGGAVNTPDPTDSSTATRSPTATDSPTATPAPLVSTRSRGDLGTVLTDADGRTLYMFTPDDAGPSVCTGGCAEAWPPLTVTDESELAADASVTADLGIAEREDGSLQVTSNGWPLYYFANDEQPGDATGQEAGNVWFVLRPDGQPLLPTVSVREHGELGPILTDANGRTLYIFTRDEDGTSACSGDCAEAWPPLTVDGPDALVGSVRAGLTLGTTARDDGSVQVTGSGRPLYYFANDEQPGDANGQGLNDVWYVVRPDGTVVMDAAGN